MKRIYTHLSVAALLLLNASLAFGTTTAYTNLVVGDHPVAFWPLNETSGTVVHDWASTNNGTIHGGVGLGVPGILSSGGVPTDTGFFFTNTFQGYVDVLNTNVNFNTPTFSMEMWLNMSNFPAIGGSANMNPVSFANGGSAIGWTWNITPANGSGAVMSGWLGKSGSWTQPSVGAPVPNKWVYYAETYNGTTFSVYSNGVLVASAAAAYSRALNNQHLYLGDYNDGSATPDGSRYYRGYMENVAVYTNVLTPTQIATHYFYGTNVNFTPAITTPPLSQTNYFGQTASFSVTASGATPFAYQWLVQSNGTFVNLTAGDPYSAVTNSSFFITNLTAANGTNYEVIVTNSFGSITSAVARLTVVAATPAIVAQPLSVSNYAGLSASFSVGAIGLPQLYYQWQAGAVGSGGPYTNLIAGGQSSSVTNTTLTISTLNAGNAADYIVVVTNSSGSVTSSVATLTVLRPTLTTTIIADSPRSYWPLNETSGTVIHDIVGTNNGTIINGTLGVGLGGPGTLYSSGVTIDVAAYFTNTANGYVAIPYPASLNTPTFSVEGWFNMPTFPVTGGNANMVPLSFDNSGTYGWLFNIAGPNGANPNFQGWCGQNAGWTTLNAGTAIQSKWGYYAMTYDGTTFKIYTNGVLAASSASVYHVLNNGDYMYIGVYNISGNNPDTTRCYAGGMENIAVYTNVLTLAQIANHYTVGTNANSGPFIATQPASVTNFFGLSQTLSVSAGAGGNNPLSYQWSKNGTPISGATNNTLVFSNLVFTNAGVYNVTITNALGSLTSTNATLTVNPQIPVVASAPSATAITVGQTLASSSLSGGSATNAAGATLPGTFAFTTPGIAPNAGTTNVSVTFTPTDNTNYATATVTVSVTVNQQTPLLATLPSATAITYGQTLASSSLSGGSETNATGGTVPGSFAFATPGIAPNAGTTNVSVVFTPTDTVDYTTATATVSVTVNQQTPVVATLPSATTITYGQTLASSSLTGGSATNAAGAAVPGTFAFTTPGIAPNPGTTNVSVTFTPTDTADYSTATATVTVTVIAPITYAAFKITDAGSGSATAGLGDLLTISTMQTNGLVNLNVNSNITVIFSGMSAGPDGSLPTVTDNTGTPQPFGSPTLLSFTNGVASLAGEAVLVAHKAETAAPHITDGVNTDAGTGGSTVSITVVAGPDNAYRISAATLTPVVGVGDALTINLVDQYQNPSSFSGNETITFGGLGGGPDGSRPTVTDKNSTPVNLGTGTTITFTGGVNTAGGSLVAHRVQNNRLLTATNGTLNAASAAGTAPTLSPTAGSAGRLGISTQPSATATAGTAFGTQPVITVLDVYGNPTTGSTAAISASAATGPLFGTTPVNAANSVATFSGLSLTNGGTNTLTFTSPGLISTNSSVITIIGGPYVALAWVTQPAGALYRTAFGTEPVLAAVDQYGNPTTNGLAPNIPVTVAMTSGPGVLSGTTNYNLGSLGSNGLVSFTDLSINAVSNNFVLTATAPLPAATTPPVTGMAVWLDASDISTVIGTSPVTQWNDKSGNNYNFGVPEGSGTITYNNTLNGRPVVTFPNGPALLTTNNAYNFTGNSMTLFCVVRHSASAFGAFEGPFSSTDGGSDNGSAGCWSIDSDYPPTCRFTRNGTQVVASQSIALNTPFIWQGADDGVNNLEYSGYYDGTTLSLATNALGAQTAFNVKQLSVGARLSGVNSLGLPWNGDVAEVLLYHSLLSPAQQTQIYNYLYGKWINGNGSLTSAATAAFTVSPAPITITGGITANSKAFDGTTNDTLTIGSVTFSGVFAPDNGNVTLNTGGAVGFFANAGPGNNIPVTVTGITTSGSAAADYVAAPLVLQANITGVVSTYNAFVITNAGPGNLTAGVGSQLIVETVDNTGAVLTGINGNITVTFSGLAAGPDGSLATVTDKNGTPVALGTAMVLNFVNGVASQANGAGVLVAHKAQTASPHITDGTATDATLGGSTISLTVVAGTYSALVWATEPSASATYGAALAVQPVLKTVDAYGNLSANGLPGSLTVDIAASGAVPVLGTTNYDIGSGSGNGVVTATGLALFGGVGASPILVATAPPLSATNSTAVSVSAKALTVTGLTGASPKVYDATTTATLAGTAALQSAEAPGGATGLDGAPYTGDTVSLAGTPVANFASSNVANGITVTVTGYAPGGAQAGNYTITQPTGLTGNITQKPLTYTGVTVPASKPYDGSTTAFPSGTPALGSSEAPGTGNSSDGLPYTGDTVGIAGLPTALYNSPDVASANTVSFSLGSVALSGGSAGNYSITVQGPQAATITAAALTLTLNSSENPSGYLDSLTFTATESAQAGSIVFATNGVTFDTEPLSGGSAVSLPTAALPRGTNTVTATYTGNPDYVGQTNLLQMVTNHPPVLNAANYSRIGGLELEIKLSDLLTNASDVDGDTLTLGYVSPSTNGTALSDDGTYIYYTNSAPPNVSDAFNYYVNDGFGGLTTNVVVLTVDNSQTGAPALQVKVVGGQTQVSFGGLPGYLYYLQRSTNLTTGTGWVPISTNTTPTNVVFTVIDTFPDLPAKPSPVFYRVLVP